MSSDGIKLKKAKLLADGWQWKIYDDGSGHLESADGKSYFSFDYATQEYVDLNNKWQFMTNYPDSTSMDMFMAEMEIDIAKSGIAEYSSVFGKIINLQNKLYHFDRYSFSPSYSDYMNVYNHTDEMYQVLHEYKKDVEDENSFDLNTINKLGEFYSNYAICNLLTDSHIEILIDAVEMERDWSNDIPTKVYNVYELICLEQGENESPIMQM